MTLICTAECPHVVETAWATTPTPESCPACPNGEPCSHPLVKFDGRKHGRNTK